MCALQQPEPSSISFCCRDIAYRNKLYILYTHNNISNVLQTYTSAQAQPSIHTPIIITAPGWKVHTHTSKLLSCPNLQNLLLILCILMKTLPHANLKIKNKKVIIADNYYQHKYLTWVKFTELHVQTESSSLSCMYKPESSSLSCMYRPESSSLSCVYKQLVIKILISWALMAMKPSLRLISIGFSLHPTIGVFPRYSGFPMHPLGCLEMKAFVVPPSTLPPPSFFPDPHLRCLRD